MLHSHSISSKMGKGGYRIIRFTKEDDRQLVSMLAKGMKFKEIAEDAARVQNRVNYIRKAYGCKNIAHLVYKFTKAGKI